MRFLSPNLVIMIRWMIITGLISGHGCGGSRSLQSADDTDQFWMNLVMDQLIRDHLQNCSLVFIADQDHQSVHRMAKHATDLSLPHTLINVINAGNESRPEREVWPLELIRKTFFNFPHMDCIALIGDVTTPSQLQIVLRMFEKLELTLWPNVKVILFGTEDKHHQILSDYFLRNIISLICISPVYSQNQEAGDRTDAALVHGRCFFCASGNASTIHLTTLHLTKENRVQLLDRVNIFPGMPDDFEGHEFNVVALSWYPITSLKPLGSEPCSEAVLQDSLDARMVIAISKVLNFKYKIRAPCDGQWGTDDGKGNWSGTVGTLQYNKADFSFLLALYHSRLDVVDFSRIYVLEPIVFIALKPQPLPKSLALIRPFANESWIVVLSSVVVASFILWILLKLSFGMNKSRAIYYADNFFMTFSIFLQKPPARLPEMDTGRMFISWWWLYCMIVTISYQSSLISHLTFPSKSVPLNYASELVRWKNEWNWGIEPLYDSSWTWFKDSTNRDIKEIFKNFQLVNIQNQTDRVLKGNYAFFTSYFYIKSIILSQFTTRFGYTPIYISKEKFLNYGGYGWGFRLGAPFRLKIDKVKNHLIEAGLIDHWMDDLIDIRARQSRRQREKHETRHGTKSFLDKFKQESFLVVLTLDHMQGAFYMYAVGCGLAFVTLLIESVIAKVKRSV